MATSSNTTTSPTVQDEDSLGSVISSDNSSESNKISSDSTADIEDAAPSTKSKSITYTRQQKITFAIVTISQFFVMTSISLPAPFLPRMDEKHGVDSDYTGWLIGIGSLIQLILSPLAGKLIPLIGLHTSIVFGLFFTGGVTALFGVLQYLPVKGTFADPDIEYLIIAFVLRAVYALGFTAFSAAGLTILSVTFKENTTTIFSYSETIVGVGIMAGPALGSGFYAVGGFMTTFAANGAIVITCSIFMYFLLPPNVGAENEEDMAPVSVCTLLSNVNLVFGLIITAYSATMWACIDPILEPELRTKYGLSQEFSALSFLLLSVTYSIMAILVGKFLDRQKTVDSISIMMFGFILMALNFIPMGPSPILTWLDPSLDLTTVRPMWLLLTCVAVLGVGLGCTIVPTLSLLFDGNSDEDETSTGNSTATNAMLSSFWASAYALGDWAGPVVSGFVVKQTSFGWTMTVYFFSTVVIVFAIIILKISQAVTRCRADNSTLTLNVNIESSEDERKPLIAKS